MTFDTIKPYVEEVLKENAQARDNDFVLIMNVYVKMGFARKLPLGIMIEYKNIDSAPAFETITRIRREVQNEENRLRPSPEVEEKRQKQRHEIYARYSTKRSSPYTATNSYLMP